MMRNDEQVSCRTLRSGNNALAFVCFRSKLSGGNKGTLRVSFHPVSLVY